MCPSKVWSESILMSRSLKALIALILTDLVLVGLCFALLVPLVTGLTLTIAQPGMCLLEYKLYLIYKPCLIYKLHVTENWPLIWCSGGSEVTVAGTCIICWVLSAGL